MLNAFYFVGGILVLMVIVGSIAAYGASQRRKALTEVADSMGFQFTPAVSLETILRLPRFQILIAGRNQVVSNMLTGSTESTQVMIFDWQFMTGGGKNSATHSTTVVAVQSVEWDLPSFYCRPETVLDWLGLTFDGKDIDFEDRPVFSKRFHLHGKNEKRVRQLFDPIVCDFFEQHEGAYAEGERDWLLYYFHGKRTNPAKIQEQFTDAFSLHVLLKGALAESATAIPDQPRDEVSPETEREL